MYSVFFFLFFCYFEKKSSGTVRTFVLPKEKNVQQNYNKTIVK